jgi:flagellar biosynthesis protein FlhF
MALGLIRSAAREAWNSGLMADEDRAAKGRLVGVFGRLLSGSRSFERAAGDAMPDFKEDDFAAVPLAKARAIADQARARSGADAPVALPGAPPQALPGSAEIESLRAEIQRLQEMIGGLRPGPAAFGGIGAGIGAIGGLHPGADFGIPYDLSHAFRKLTEAGVSAERAAELLLACQGEMGPLQMKKKPLVEAWLARQILGTVAIAREPYRDRVHLFLGGPGSGKTSTLIKMASHLVVKEKRRVAVATADAQKVGAVDQLKIYCQILNVPLAIVRDKTDWESALRQLQGFDCVLADFPGLQLRDRAEAEFLRSLLPPDSAQAARHLVISSTSKDADALGLESRYRVAECTDLIFTNLDQSAQHGLIYNVQQGSQLPLHSLSAGNQIPEDFELATRERILDLIFKLSPFRNGKPKLEAI